MTTRPGPEIRADLIEVYLLRTGSVRPAGAMDREGNDAAGGRGAGEAEFLQLHRKPRTGRIAPDTWQPVMGHIEPGERALEAAWREAREETGVAAEDVLGFWQLEQVYPFLLAGRDQIVMSPRFVLHVREGWEPALNEEHDEFRWLPLVEARRRFLWPGQRFAIAEIEREILSPDSVSREALRLRIPAD